jgi:hypothetical protein
VTQHEYDAVESYRNLGGNLMFLSANNFFWKITIDRGVMTRVAKWRDGRDADMTYYEMPAGAKVFAAGPSRSQARCGRATCASSRRTCGSGWRRTDA